MKKMSRERNAKEGEKKDQSIAIARKAHNSGMFCGAWGSDAKPSLRKAHLESVVARLARNNFLEKAKYLARQAAPRGLGGRKKSGDPSPPSHENCLPAKWHFQKKPTRMKNGGKKKW